MKGRLFKKIAAVVAVVIVGVALSYVSDGLSEYQREAFKIFVERML